MHLYDVGYHTCEESAYTQYRHELSFSEEELAGFVEDCLEEALKKRLAYKEKYMGRLTFQELMSEAVIWPKGAKEPINVNLFNLAMRSRGFTPARFTASYSTFGWSSAVKPGDWSSTNGNGQFKLQERLTAIMEEFKARQRKKRRRS